MTIVPIDLFGYGALALGVLGMILWCRAPFPDPTWAKVSGWFGLILLFAGGFSFPIKYDLQGRAARTAAFAELPTEWQDFYHGMNKLQSSLYSEAIGRFVRTNPPRLTLDQHAALIGSNLWSGGGETGAMRSLKCSKLIDSMVRLDFAEGKK